MDYLPIFLNIKDWSCLVVGGGEVAARKVALLARAGAHVTILAPTMCDSLALLVCGHIHHQIGVFDDKLLAPYKLIIAATDDGAVNRRIHGAAIDKNILVNVVDCPELCTFILPSIVDRSPILVAVSSGGAAPVLARLLRARLETLIPAAYGRLALLAGEFRNEVKKKFPQFIQRRRFWEGVLQGPIAEMVLAGKEYAAQNALIAALVRPGSPTPVGEVYLVGAGPGDPDLLTFRALRLMQQADVVLYDHLVAAPILDLVRREAERIYAGKERSNHALEQESINALLVRLAKTGKRVLRLKGGDPFIFGRGGEEIETLAAEGIPFQVVPGITAATGCASYAGIPLTHRDYAQSCLFVTGHLKDGSMNLNWDALVQPRQTIVVYMGLIGVAILCQELITRGLSPDLPAALIQQGTTAQQRVVIATLSTLADAIDRAQVRPPTLIIIGEVVHLHNKLAWFGEN